MTNNKKTTREDYSLILTAFGSFVKQLRKERGEKLQAVSAALNITHPVVSKIENGTYTSLNYRIVSALLGYYGVPLSQLLLYMAELASRHEGRPPQATTAMLSIINDAEKLSAKIQQIGKDIERKG